MSELNLVAKDKTQELILQYLQQNASESLVNKINNGVRITYDGVELINRKSLDGFVKYASDEARKLVDKNASSACVEDATVFGWAIHYFEEDSVLGALFNVDGTPYKLAKVQNTATANSMAHSTLPIPKSDPSGQMSIFDLDTSCRETDSKIDDESACDIVDTDTEVDSESDIKCDICEVKQQISLPTGGDIELESAIRGKVMTADGEFVDYVEFDGDIEESALEVQVVTSRNTQSTLLNIKLEPPITLPKLAKKPLGSIIYERYMSGHERYPKAMVATKVGDFYEFFAGSAIAVSSEFDLTLTGRDCGFESRVPMCGIPYHCAEKYFGWILKNHDLLIVEGDNTMKYTPKYPTQEELLIAENATCASDLTSTSRTSEHEKNSDNMAAATDTNVMENSIIADTNVAKNSVVTSPTMTVMLPESHNRIRELLALFGECLEVKI